MNELPNEFPSSQPSDETLSAYFDDELSVQERIEVEVWLVQDPEAKQKLADFRRLSRMFEETPRIEVSAEFAQEVLQLAERRMLLPEASSRRLTNCQRLAWLALPATAAAAIVAVVLSVRPNHQLPEIASGGGGISSPEDVEVNSPEMASNSGRFPENSNAALSEADRVAALESNLVTEIDRALEAADDVGNGEQCIPALLIHADSMDGLALNVELKNVFDKSAIHSAATSGAPSEATGDQTVESQAYLIVLTNGEPIFEALAALIKERHGDLIFQASQPIRVADLEENSRAQLEAVLKEVALADSNNSRKSSATAADSGPKSPSNPADDEPILPTITSEPVAPAKMRPVAKNRQNVRGLLGSQSFDRKLRRFRDRAGGSLEVTTESHALSSVPGIPPVQPVEIKDIDQPKPAASPATQFRARIRSGYRPLPLSQIKPTISASTSAPPLTPEPPSTPEPPKEELDPETIGEKPEAEQPAAEEKSPPELPTSSPAAIMIIVESR